MLSSSPLWPFLCFWYRLCDKIAANQKWKCYEPLACLSCDSARNCLILSEGMAKEIPAVTFRVLMPITSPSCGTHTQTHTLICHHSSNAPQKKSNFLMELVKQRFWRLIVLRSNIASWKQIRVNCGPLLFAKRDLNSLFYFPNKDFMSLGVCIYETTYLCFATWMLSQ